MMKLTEPLARTLDREIMDYIADVKTKDHSESYLIGVLHRVQARYGFLSQQHMQEVAEALGVPAATVSGVATFYHFFRLEPQGTYRISVCLGTACYVKGADRIHEAFRKELGIEEGETTTDGMFSLESTRCLGVCGQAPVVTINERVIGKVTPEMIPSIIKELCTQAGKRQA
jgi:NADH:ubiquinone oxidoreductase subunit E